MLAYRPATNANVGRLRPESRYPVFDELSEIGAYELYFDGIETYSLHFTDLMRSGEIFQGNHLPSIIETAVKYAHNPKWLNEKIATPKKYITQSKRRPTTRAVDLKPAAVVKVESYVASSH